MPTHLVVTLVEALGLWAGESMRHALAEVVAGWRQQPRSRRTRWQLPSAAAIGQARQRAGARLVRSNVILEPIELLSDGSFPAQLLAGTSCERWEIETTLDEIKAHQSAHPAHSRASSRARWSRRSMACCWHTCGVAP